MTIKRTVNREKQQNMPTNRGKKDLGKTFFYFEFMSLAV